ncbi:unnamed protein product [Coregonus sp. 'balchen']|nr:unnamed protein product [Coregonus sp. 'balchen']
MVSFVSRIPVVFPTGDANSLSRSVVMYACNKNVDLAIQHGGPPACPTPPRAKAASSNSLRLSIFTPKVLMISTNADGSLNQWESAFSTVLSVSHKSRYCGHRFHLNALRTPDVDSVLAALSQPLRDPNAINSELILWRLDPVDPLSFSGGVSELARINSLHSSAFSNVAWLPTLIPSNCLGVYCNSPSACFVASDASSQPGFSARFFLVVVEFTQTGRSLLHMWHLQLAALPIIMDETSAPPERANFPRGSEEQALYIQPAECLTLTTHRLYSWELALPDGVEVINVTPSAVTGGSTTRDSKPFSKGESSDYTEIDSIPPLPLYALLAADEDCSPKPKDKVASVSGDSGHGSSQTDAYDDLFQSSGLGVEDLEPMDSDQEDGCAKVIDLSQYSPTFFGPEHAQVLSSHLLHSSLPGLTRMEQMSLMALADTIATTSADIRESQSKSKTLDECGLKFLLSVRLHTFLLTTLPLAHRAQLLRQGSKSIFSKAERSSGRCHILSRYEKESGGLGTVQKNVKMTAFFSNNFSEDRWRMAALKNAFSLLGKQRFQHSAAFFLLAGSLKDAVEVCLEKMQDLQLALVISRLYESEFETSSTYKRILQKHVLGQACQLPAHQDPFLRSMAYWVLEDYSRALHTLLGQPAAPNPGSFTQAGHSTQPGTSSMSPSNPEVFNFYTYLRTHPLLLRRHFGSSEKARVGWLPMLALEVLSKMPKVLKRSKLHQDDPTNPDLSETKKVQASELDWSQPVLNGFKSVSDSLSNCQSDSVLSFDWSEPSVAVQDEALELKWNSDEEEDDDYEPQGLAMKNTSTDNNSSTPLEEDDILLPSEDILAAQLKFSACLKILTTELQTLSTGYELDRGKLGYQLCQWLEREVVALQRCCNPACRSWPRAWKDQGERRRSRPSLERPSAPADTGFRATSLSCACSSATAACTAPTGEGLASVRMVLILLLQKSQQVQHNDDRVQMAIVPYLPISLLLAYTASAKTVVANPIVHLTNHTHDILHTINALDSPPHPDVINNEIYVTHTLAASLSACIYQCLVTATTTAPPGTHREHGGDCPAQHLPSTVARYRCSDPPGEESQPGLAVLLCEILTAVFLILFVHGLATHSSNELFRIVAHPLNSKLWVAVFGGGACTPVTEKPSPAKSPPVSTASEGSDRKYKRFKLLSSRSASREGPASSVVEQETSIFKEHFVSPELSISLGKICLFSVYFELKIYPWSLLCDAVLKTLQRWEQVLLKRLEIFGGPPSKYISTHPLDKTGASGSVILRHKAMSSHHSALPVKRLWQYLVKQEKVQETFIRNIFTKKRDQNEVDADLGYPRGKARIIHKESDITTAFAINKERVSVGYTGDYNEQPSARCHESLAPRQQLLITGGRKGWISVLELPHWRQRQSVQAHDSPVKALAVDPTEGCFISGSAESNIKVWGLSTQCLLHQFPNEHARQSLFRNLGTGVMQIEVGPANHIFSCGADGTMKMRILPDHFSVNNGNLKNDVKFII